MNMNRLALAWDAWRAGRGGPGAIAARQRARVADLVAFARKRSPYYADHYRDLPPDGVELRQLPPVTKPDLMKRFDEWVTDPAVTESGVRAFMAEPSRAGEWYLDRYLVWKTSGTTGVPAILVQDRGALAVHDVMEIVRLVPLWFSLRDLRAIRQRGAPAVGFVNLQGHGSERVMSQRRSRRRRWLKQKIVLLSLFAPVPELVSELNTLQPTVLAGHSTVLSLLAEEQEAGRLKVRPVLVFTGAEPLPPELRGRFEQTFGGVVRETYGCSEALSLAWGCSQGWCHLNADWMILEPVDRSYQPTPPGEISHTVLLTNLANRVQPILRYDLGDRVLVSPERCPCGSRLPAIRVEGRTDEILAFSTPGGGTLRLSPRPVVSTINKAPGVHRFQVIQTGPARLVVRLQAVTPGDEGAVWPGVRERLQAYLRHQGLPDVVVERALEPPALDPLSGKFRQVWSELRPIG
jgi:phenylacetate-coenzyme A ligase PaaK-like adenylate-forming protein